MQAVNPLYLQVHTYVYIWGLPQILGRVVIVTSVRGHIPWPADSAYHVTKHGLETMADSLRLEMQKFGVKVSVVVPGNYGTATACQNEQHVSLDKQEVSVVALLNNTQKQQKQ